MSRSAGWRDRSPARDTFASIQPLLASGAPLLELLRVGAERSVTRRVEETDFYITLSLRVAALCDPSLQVAATERVVEGMAAHEDLFGAVLAMAGRRIREPFTMHHLTATVSALAEGFAVQDTTPIGHPRILRDDVPPGVGRDWTLFGMVLHVLLNAFTEAEDIDPSSEDMTSIRYLRRG